jgi:hypothetical protein
MRELSASSLVWGSINGARGRRRGLVEVAHLLARRIAPARKCCWIRFRPHAGDDPVGYLTLPWWSPAPEAVQKYMWPCGQKARGLCVARRRSIAEPARSTFTLLRHRWDGTTGAPDGPRPAGQRHPPDGRASASASSSAGTGSESGSTDTADTPRGSSGAWRRCRPSSPRFSCSFAVSCVRTSPGFR